MQNELIFNEIFVKPKQLELEKFKRDQQSEVEMLLENKQTAIKVINKQ